MTPIKRLLPLAPLPLLLLLTMGVGPCESKPLGSVDGCTYNGKTYASGMSFPAADGCNTCSCEDGKAACSLLGCSDGGMPDSGSHCYDSKGNAVPCMASDGGTGDAGAKDGGGTCTDANGKTVPCGMDGGSGCTYGGKTYPLGASFLCTDGCNMCSCTASGVVGTTKGCPDGGGDAQPTCFDNLGNVIPCATDGGAQCVYENKVYKEGEGFPSSDGCNTCSCTAGGMIACTLRACGDAAVPPDGGPAGVCMLGADQTCNDDPMLNTIIGKCRPDLTCECGTATPNPKTGRCVAPAATMGCSYEGTTYPVGSKFMCPTIDNGCNQGVCFCATPGQTVALCPTDSIPVCGFDATYVYGRTGGLVLYTDQVTLTPPASYVLVRTATANGGTVAGGSCGPALPACNSGPVDVSHIMHDIADPTVQLLLSLSTMQTTLLGTDPRPMDGTVFSFKRNGTAGFLVGMPCKGASNCTEIPAAVDNLMADLQKLDAQQQQDPSCAAFLKKTM